MADILQEYRAHFPNEPQWYTEHRAKCCGLSVHPYMYLVIHMLRLEAMAMAGILTSKEWIRRANKIHDESRRMDGKPPHINTYNSIVKRFDRVEHLLQ
jgi:hypothetical protein